MNLKGFSFVSPVIQASELLRVIEVASPPGAIEQAIAETKDQECRTRSLPAHLVISLVITMSLRSRDSMRDVLKNLIDGLIEAWVKVVFPAELLAKEYHQREVENTIDELKLYLLGRKTPIHSQNPRWCKKSIAGYWEIERYDY